MREPLIQIITGAPRPQLRPLVAGYSGYRVDGAEPGIHRGLPSRYLTIIVTLSGTVDLSALPDPAQPPASFTTLAGGLHARPALISHDGRQHGIQLHLTPLGARVLLGLPAGELAHTVVDLGTLLGASARLRSGTPACGAAVGLAAVERQPWSGRDIRAGPRGGLEPPAP